MNGRRDWIRTVAYVALIVATVVLSYSTLRDRALHSGFVWWAAWLYPPAIDATIIVASRTWRDPSLSARTRGLAAVVTLAAVAAGVSAFVVEHAADGPTAVVFAALVPLALASAIVLTSWSATDRRDRAAAESELGDAVAVRAAAAAERDAEQATAVAHAEEMERLAERAEKARRDANEARQHTTERITRRTAPASRSSSPKRAPAATTDLTTAVAWGVDRLARGETAGWRSIDGEFGLGEHRSKKAAQQARQQHEQTPRIHAVKEA